MIFLGNYHHFWHIHSHTHTGKVLQKQKDFKMGKSVLKLKQEVSAGASMGACVCMGDFMILKQANKHNKQVERNTQHTSSS